MQTTAAQRSRIPAIARGLLILALALSTLFLLAALLPWKAGAGPGAAFVLLTATTLLVSLLVVPLPKAPWIARAAQHILVALLITLGITILPKAAPLWLPLAVLVIFTAGSESTLWTVTLGLGSGLLLAAATRSPAPLDFLADVLGLGGLALAASGSFARLKTRTFELGRVITKMRQGADFLETEVDPDKTFRGTVRKKEGQALLHEVSEEARTLRDLERSAHLTKTLAPFLELARAMNHAHAALFFDIDRGRGGAFLRAYDGPENVSIDAVLPLDTDPVGFILDRERPFYATDFRGLLWALPYYKKEARIGSLIAVPVFVRGAVKGLLAVDHEETQALGNAEPVLKRIAHLISQVVENERETFAHAEREVEFEAAAEASQSMAVITEVATIHQFVARAVKDMAPKTIGTGIVRLRGETIEGLPGMSEVFQDWMGSGSRKTDRTWMSWYLNNPQPERMRIDTPRDRALPLFRPGGGLPGESLLVQPLIFRNRLQGALVAVGEKAAFDASVGRVISLMSNQAAAAIALIELLEANRQLALRDGLTNLLNRRAFDEALERAASQASRGGQSLSLLMIDLDHFKRLNDAYGHTAGDLALQTAAAEIRLQVRGGDLAARYGGEEFAVILPDTDGAAAFRMAERVRKALADRVIKVGDEQIRITASCGVSATDLGYESPEELLRSADEALYASKETGRNRTSLAGAPRK